MHKKENSTMSYEGLSKKRIEEEKRLEKELKNRELQEIKERERYEEEKKNYEPSSQS